MGSKTGSAGHMAQAADVLDLTEDEPAGHAEQALSLLWLSTALEWGPLCSPASIMCWAEAMQKVCAALCCAVLCCAALCCQHVAMCVV